MKKYLIYLLSITLILQFFTACGKVSQETGVEEKEAKSFDLSYFLEVNTTSNLNILKMQTSFFVTNNYILLNEFPIYAIVEGIKLENNEVKWQELSWGSGVLSISKEPTALSTVNQQLNTNLVSPNTTTLNQSTASPNKSLLPKINYTAKSYDKKGIQRIDSDLSWTTMSFENQKNHWNFTSKKIKLGYPRYFIKIFTNDNHYYFKLLEDTSINEKSANNLGEITLYDTFIASLFLIEITNNPKTENLLNTKDLSTLFTREFFANLPYQKPNNLNAKFDTKTPSFSLNRNLEKELLKIYNLYKADKTDKLETKTYLSSLKTEAIPTSAIEILVKTIEELPQ